MPETVIKLPDIGEGIAEAEISEWMVDVGDQILEDDPLVAVLTDKATVEIPSSVSGRVTWRAGDPGDTLAIGAPLVRIEVAGAGEGDPEPEGGGKEAPGDSETGVVVPRDKTTPEAPALSKGRALAAPAVRRRAADLGIDLAAVPGSGPDGQVTHADLDRRLASGGYRPLPAADDTVVETPVIGLRRKIAEQMALSHAHIPQITIVEETDVTELERLRARLNADGAGEGTRLTLLPFLIRAIVLARDAAPQVNARYDDGAGVLHRFDAVHAGIATQTERGLVVPVLHHAEALSVPDMAAGIARLADSARDGSIAREALGGATITITSLGPLGAVASTPLVNHPEVAIVGVNRKQIRPLWDGRAFVPREMMNLSASFDHRIVDGWDAASFVARLKTLIETPALLFV
ncbi:dihydrolipoamide acetyltransferase family protein [Tropicimonas sp.]|uniref:dihydrolipoamide acetyltransferase family protein n=1 Tax=Tropicimonas sp. TaxID=2067044 RepID=UPI003A848CCD